MKYIKNFEAIKYINIYFKIYSKNGKYNIEDLYYDIDYVEKYDIDYEIFHTSYLNIEDFLYVYLFPDTKSKINNIEYGIFNNFNISSIVDSNDTKENNIDKILKHNNLTIIKLDDLYLILNANKFNL